MIINHLVFLSICSLGSAQFFTEKPEFQSLGILTDERTIPGIGTFRIADFGRRPLFRYLPDYPEKINIEFLLFTKENPNKERYLHFNHSETISQSPFKGNRPTKFIIHGFREHQETDAKWMHHLKDAILAVEDVNVIIVDWSFGAKPPYGQAAVNTWVVGRMVGVEIELLSRVAKTDLSNFHIIGHSLGSHVSGYAGKFLKGKVGRISGLDPAGPEFETLKPIARLWHTDAQFVDSIHTDAHPLYEHLGYGMYETCSDVDIYPNGGKSQPGCDQERWPNIFDNKSHYLLSCYHHRSVDFFIASYLLDSPLPKAYLCPNYEDFQAGKCTDCGQHGEKCLLLGRRAIEHKDYLDENHAGGTDGKRHFMITDQHEPFLGKYQYIVHIKMASQGLEQFDRHSKIHIDFLTEDGHSEEFKFNDETELQNIFKLGQSYIHPGVADIDPPQLFKIEFEWDRHLLPQLDNFKDFSDVWGGWNLKPKLHVDSIEVIGLTTSQSTIESKPIVMKFCNPKAKEGIERQKHVIFEHCN